MIKLNKQYAIEVNEPESETLLTSDSSSEGNNLYAPPRFALISNNEESSTEVFTSPQILDVLREYIEIRIGEKSLATAEQRNSRRKNIWRVVRQNPSISRYAPQDKLIKFQESLFEPEQGRLFEPKWVHDKMSFTPPTNDQGNERQLKIFTDNGHLTNIVTILPIELPNDLGLPSHSEGWVIGFVYPEKDLETEFKKYRYCSSLKEALAIYGALLKTRMKKFEKDYLAEYGAELHPVSKEYILQHTQGETSDKAM